MTGPQIPVGSPVAGSNGEPLGAVAAVYLDNETGRLAWAAVQGGRGTAVVPLQVSRFDGAVLHIPYGADRLATAPLHDPDTLISYAEGDDLARHYGLIPALDAGTDDGATAPSTPGDEVMIRSEQRLRSGVVNVVVGRARLVTYVVTEEQTFTVPVRRQEVRLVYDAIPGHTQYMADAPPAEETHEVVLHGEQVLFTTQVVPIERVRMVRRVHTTGQRVTENLAAEHIDLAHIPAGQADTDATDVEPGERHRAGDDTWD